MIKEKFGQVEVDRMGIGIETIISISVDIQVIVQIGGKVIEIYEAILHRETYKLSLLENFVEKLFNLRFKHRIKVLMKWKNVIKDTGNGLYGQTSSENIEYELKCVNKKWMESEYGTRVVEYWQLTSYYYFSKLT